VADAQDELRDRTLMESMDLVQSVWTDILDDLSRFEDRGPDSFFRWLHTCLLHKIDQKRRHHGAHKRDAHRTTPLSQGAETGHRAPRDPTPSEVVMGGEEAERVLRELSRFPEEQRLVLLLRMRDELGYEEIAARVGKSVEAVKKIYSRGLKRLIERLAPSGVGR
jgi:RNA polymerase sigma-70 factor (ECF subfamily)